jgi:alpha/beta superfamily hydrolase
MPSFLSRLTPRSRLVALLLLLAPVALCLEAQPHQAAVDRSLASRDTNTLIEGKLVAVYSKAHLDSLWKANKVPKAISKVRYSVEVYEILYWTSWHDGSRIQASGLYYLPQEKRNALPLVSFNHGSRSNRRTDVELESEAIITTALAADGYAALLPDYIGLGRDQGRHLYQHAPTEAMATIDMLRAVRALNRKLGVGTNGQLFLSGYSQGGHAAMATHKWIETHFADEFPLTASAPLSGAYDMEGTQAESMFREYSRPGYFAFLIWGMNEAYGMYPDLRDALKPEYAEAVASILDRDNFSLRELGKVMPAVPAEIIRPEILEAYAQDPNFPMRLAMRENSLVNWAPTRPMLLCYCDADEQVDPRNAQVAYDRMRELGSESVRIRRVSRKMTHRDCAPYAAFYAKMYFDSFVKGSEKGRKGPVGKRMLMSVGKMTYKPD